MGIELLRMDHVRFDIQPVRVKRFFGLWKTIENWAVLSQDATRVFRWRDNDWSDTVRAGYRWNGSSIPGFAQPVLGGRLDGPSLQGSLWHDIGYGTHTFPRRVEDALLGLSVDYICWAAGDKDWKGEGDIYETACNLGGEAAWKRGASKIAQELEYRSTAILRTAVERDGQEVARWLG